MCAQHTVTQPVKNRPEDDYLLVETCSLHITLCNKTVVLTQKLVLQHISKHFVKSSFKSCYFTRNDTCTLIKSVG